MKKEFITGPEWMTVAAYWQTFEAAFPKGAFNAEQLYMLKGIFYGGATSTTNMCKRLLMDVRDGTVDSDAAIWKVVELEKEVMAFLEKKKGKVE